MRINFFWKKDAAFFFNGLDLEDEDVTFLVKVGNRSSVTFQKNPQIHRCENLKTGKDISDGKDKGPTTVLLSATRELYEQL